MSESPLDELIEHNIKELEKYSSKLPGIVVVHDLRDWSVLWMSETGLKQLGVTLEEVTSITAAEYYARFFNAEDAKDYVPKILGLLENNNDEDFCTYFQQVRFASKADWSWHMGSSKIFMRDDNGKPLLTITMAFPIDSMHHMTAKAERVLQENNFLRKHFHNFNKLSKREQEILKHLALGKSATEIGETLFISEHTVETHKKNIRQKLKANSLYELGEYARAFDLI
jgi:DNA-binding CsgD family transcriptional regulator